MVQRSSMRSVFNSDFEYYQRNYSSCDDSHSRLRNKQDDGVRECE